MNLTEWARAQGVAPRTAYRWFREGTLPVAAERVGPRTILVNIDANTSPSVTGLGRGNVELVEAALAAAGRRLVVLDDGEVEVEDGLERDTVEVLTSLCARLYGRRSAKNRATKALEAAAADG
ncbi:hypothetical protein ACFCWG_49340 [Streptomyces sp. NPDC056390]|uniref:hypothetical protein n=1 Tax=Streptomyces sp. NPDC056390 TaxID=3345806 RepID=UPI0035DE1DF0